MNKRTSDAFQKAARNVSRDRLIRGKICKLYGYGDNKTDLIKQASHKYSFVYVKKTPYIMHKVDPDTATYVAYVHGKIHSP
jgi:hypothetical protein